MKVPPLYLLDTNILVHLIRGDAVGEHLRNHYKLLMQQPTPILSFVSLAELRSLALQWGWARPRLEQLAFYASHFATAPLETPEMLDAFALLDSWSERHGRSLGKNDPWIAAATYVQGATLLTTDADFEPFDPLFFPVERITPIVR